MVDATELTRAVVAAYVRNNSVPVAELPALIATIHGAIAGLSTAGAADAPDAPNEKPSPAQIRKSIQHDGIVSFIDGRPYKTLKRHLTSHGLDPRSYRARYALPDDYPMVATSYRERRSALAKAIGLGQPGMMVQKRQT